jgi:membrane-bound ClpP family serine protease
LASQTAHNNAGIFLLYLTAELSMKTTFTKKNYYILIAGIAFILLGYILMIGGGSDDPNVFNPAIFGFQRVTLAPIVCLIGFVTIIVAIMWRPKNEGEPAK